MARRNEILHYRNEAAATRAMRRVMRKYEQQHGRPVACKVDVVSSTHWAYPFEYLIRCTGNDGSVSYWSRD
jgi:hypothetical protein